MTSAMTYRHISSHPEVLGSTCIQGDTPRPSSDIYRASRSFEASSHLTFAALYSVGILMLTSPLKMLRLGAVTLLLERWPTASN